MRTSFKVKGKSQGHQADIMLRPEVRHYLPNGKAYELQTWCTDGGRRLIAVMDHHQQGQRLRSRCHVVRLTGPVLAHNSRTKSLRKVKIGK